MLNCVVVIPTLNEESKIGELIQSLNDDEYPNKEIIVVDGGSKDKTVEISEKNGAIVILEKGENKSLPMARNQGAEYAIKGGNVDVLCFIDGDLVLSHNFVSNAMVHFNEDSEMMAVRTVANSIRDSVLMKAYSPVEDITKLIKKNTNAPPPPAHFYRKDIFELAGGFEPLGFREDWTFYNKVRKIVEEKGGKIILEEKCTRYGKFDSIKEFYKQQEWYGRTFVPYVKYAGWKSGAKDLLILRPIGYITGGLLAGIVFLATGKSVFLIIGIPIGIEMVKMVYKSVRYRSAYIIPHFFLNSIGNYFFIGGIIKYIIGDRKLSRGEG
jgi:glycosyltransferase involved in cell wall biosynthesis